ncbi:MAG: GNAT family N-acetyltransferase [Planctomycetia bacterium]|nr:GNAT family N-acetyltransferase [Planctomycetia bacterium]
MSSAPWPQAILLNGADAAAWAHLTFPSYVRFLTDPDSSIVVVGVRAWGRPAALGLARVDGESAEILSLYVVPDWRRQKLGTAVWKLIESELSQRGVRSAFATFSHPDVDVLQTFCGHCGWTAPVPSMHLVFAERWGVEGIPCFARLTGRPDWQLFPWAELTPRERELIEARLAAGEVPYALNPFIDDAYFEPATSLGVRQEGAVVGWQVNHRLAPVMHRFTATWVAAVPGSARMAMWLMGESVRRYLAQDIPRAVMGIQAGNARMLEFFDRRLRPHMSEIRTTYRAECHFPATRTAGRA